MTKVLLEVGVWCNSMPDSAYSTKYIVADSLSGLISQVAKKDFRLVETFEIVSESGTAVESEEVFIFLTAKATKFFIKKIEGPKEVSIQDNLSESPAILPAVTDGEVNLHPNTSTTLASNAQSADCEATLEDDITVLDTKDYYHIPNILRLMRSGIKGMTADNLIKDVLKEKICPDNLSKLILHGAGTWLMVNCKERKEFYPSPEEFLKLAKSIVKFFPSTGNMADEKEPWNILYDYNTRRGLLEFYIRQKRSREGKSLKRQPGPPSKKQRLLKPTETFSEAEIEDAEKFMRQNVVDKSNLQLMLYKLQVTRESRRKLVMSKEKDPKFNSTFILNKYPLLYRLNQAVEEDFVAEFGSNFQTFVEKWNDCRLTLVEVASRKLKGEENRKIILDAKVAATNFETEKENLLILELLLRLLPNTNSREMVRGVKTWNCLSLLLHQFDAGTPMREAQSNASDMIQPGLLIIGNDYYIKIDQLFMKIENASLELGLAYVVGFYHVLNLQYPLPLKFVFVFFETLFGMPPSIKSTCVENLQSHLAA